MFRNGQLGVAQRRSDQLVESAVAGDIESEVCTRMW